VFWALGDNIINVLNDLLPDSSLLMTESMSMNNLNAAAMFINYLSMLCKIMVSRDGKKKQNLRCVRFDIDGEAHALLIAIRDIRKGERLYYDYNGYQHDYPTEHFV
jgi:hypothetical protein